MKQSFRRRNAAFVLIAAATTIAGGPALAQRSDINPAATVTAARAAPSQAALSAQMAEYASRAALANQLVNRFEADAAQLVGASFNAASWRQDFAMRAMQQPVEALKQALTAPNLSMAQNELFNAQRSVAKHSFDTDLVLNFITPCRIVDTRFGGGGQLGPAYRLWEATASAATIAAQGGNAAGCGSINAEGWVLNVTVVPPSGNTSPNFLTIQHDNTPVPPATASMNFVNQNISTFVVTANQGSNPGGFYAYSSGLTHVVIDLVGYTARTQNTYALDCALGTQATASLDTTTRSYNVFAGACPSGYALTSVTCQGSGDFGNLQQSGGGVNGTTNANCFGTYVGSSTVTVRAQPWCCRVPAGI